jgi:DtxR family Mn-dependent transcriptional regulator
MKKKEGLTHSLLKYLRCIYLISLKRKVVRIKEIAERNGVSTSAATQAVKELAKKGYVLHEHYGFVELTEKGEKLAKELFKMSQYYIDFFVEYLDVPREIAEEDVCKMIHYFNPKTLEKLRAFIEKIKKGDVVSEAV